MPRSPAEAKTGATGHAGGTAWIETALLSPARAALLTVAFYVLLCAPILAAHHADPATFVVAGDRYVDAAQTRQKLPVKAQSDGYDGQFFYRMAVAPFATRPVADGIVFDHPAKRLQRFLYPLIAFALCAGQPRFAAWALFLVNLAGIGAIAAGASLLARRLALPGRAVLAMLCWPGLIVTLTHDTAEIAAAAFLVWSLAALLAQRWSIYAVLAAFAMLSRETSLPVFAGILAWQVWRGLGPAKARQALGAAAASASALAVFAAWHIALGRLAGEAADAQPVARDIGLPFIGVARMLLDCISGARSWASTPAKDAAIRGIVMATAPVILLVCGRIAWGLPAAFRRRDTAPLAAGWFATACLMSLLTAAGPWIDPLAYFRAFTECFVLGCLVLFASPRALGLRLVAILGGVEMLLVWALCFLKLRS